MKQAASLIIAILLVVPLHTMACSMYKITKEGRTIVGNNEDYFSPNHQFWYEYAQVDTFGVLYMGQLDNFAQGAINDQGLLFDGFFEPYLEINNTAGKKEIPIAKAIRNVMQTMSTVEEVKIYLESISLSMLTRSMLVFVDKTGSYLIVEGDVIEIGEETEMSFSNFYYSQTENLEDVNLDYFQRGRKFTESTKGGATLDYCGKAMGQFSQSKIAATQYSTVYDLENLTVRVYLFHDFSEFVDIDLKKELKKGDHKIMIPELFSKQSKGYQHYLKYNNPEHPTLFIEEMIGDAQISEAEFNAMQFENILSPIGYEWLDLQKNPAAAIQVFSYALDLMPNNAKLHTSLGEAYAENKEWANAYKSYKKALSLDPDSETIIEKINYTKKKKDSVLRDQP